MQPEKGPNPNYDFIMKDTPPPKRSLLPTNNPILMIAGVVILILLLIVIYGVISGSKGSKGATAIIDSLGKAQEISRVTTAQATNLKDPNTLAIAATTQAAVGSEQTQLNKFLVSHKVKVDKKKLALYQNKNTDSQMATALQTNSLDSAYLTYLKGALNDYSQSLKTSYSSTTSASARAIQQDAFDSTQTLLSSPTLKQ